MTNSTTFSTTWLPRLDSVMTIDLTQESPMDVLHGTGPGGIAMKVSRTIRRSESRSAIGGAVLYTHMQVVLGGEVVDNYGLSGDEQETALIEWWEGHCRNIATYATYHRTAMKSAYGQAIASAPLHN